MCGRYTHRLTWRQIHDLYRLTLDYRPNIEARYNIAPTQIVPIVRNAGGERVLRMMRWGWERAWAKHTIINATAEKVSTSRVFTAAFEERRCLVPADGFYEWHTENGTRQPYRIIVSDEEPFAMAGIWETWKADKDGYSYSAGDELEAFTIITTEANDTVKGLHNRMPVILPPDVWDGWLDCSVGPEVLRPYDGKMRAYRVSRAVNNVKNDRPELIEAL